MSNKRNGLIDLLNDDIDYKRTSNTSNPQLYYKDKLFVDDNYDNPPDKTVKSAKPLSPHPPREKKKSPSQIAKENAEAEKEKYQVDLSQAIEESGINENSRAEELENEKRYLEDMKAEAKEKARYFKKISDELKANDKEGRKTLDDRINQWLKDFKEEHPAFKQMSEQVARNALNGNGVLTGNGISFGYGMDNTDVIQPKETDEKIEPTQSKSTPIDNIINEKVEEDISDNSDKGTSIPTTNEIVETVIDDEKKEDNNEKKEEVIKQANIIRRGIWTDYKNGLFGDKDTKGISYDQLTDDQKERRKQALSQAWRYTADNIGTMFWNIGTAFGRKDGYVDNEYAKLLRLQNEELIKNDASLQKKYNEFKQELEMSKEYANLSDSEKEAYVRLRLLGGDANKENLLTSINLGLHSKLFDDMKISAYNNSLLKNEQLKADIENTYKDIGVKDANINKTIAEISRIAVENKLTETQIENILKDIARKTKELKYFDQKAIADIVGNWVGNVSGATNAITDIVKIFK